MSSPSRRPSPQRPRLPGRRARRGCNCREGRRRPPIRTARSWISDLPVGTPLRWVAGLMVLANLLVLTGSPVPGLAPLAGFLLVMVLPIMLVFQKIDWIEADAAERVVVSVGVTILGLMVGGLVLNQVGRAIGIERPLDTVPVLIALDIGLIGLLAWRRDRLHMPANVFRQLPEGTRLIGGGALAIVASIIGAIRLNNGASGYFTVAMLIGVVTIFALLIVRRARLSTTVISIVLYELGLSALLMTSLRGWYVTGHDIQLEYQVFQLDGPQRQLGHVAFPGSVQRVRQHHDPAHDLRAAHAHLRSVRLQGRVPGDLRGLPGDRLPARPAVRHDLRGAALDDLLHRVPHVLHGHAVPQPAGDGVRVRGHRLPRRNAAALVDAAGAHLVRRDHGRGPALALLDELRLHRHPRAGLRGRRRARPLCRSCVDACVAGACA